MHGSRPAICRRPWRKAALWLIALTVTFESASVVAAEPRADSPERNWPCRQILVGRLSLAAVWSGPSIEGLAWRNDRAVGDIVARLAARRTPLDAAERAIEDFAQSQGAGKTKQLVSVFAGLFETLNDERTQVIEGLSSLRRKTKGTCRKNTRRERLAARRAGQGAAASKQARRGDRSKGLGMGPARFRRTAPVAHLCVRDAGAHRTTAFRARQGHSTQPGMSEHPCPRSRSGARLTDVLSH